MEAAPGLWARWGEAGLTWVLPPMRLGVLLSAQVFIRIIKNYLNITKLYCKDFIFVMMLTKRY